MYPGNFDYYRPTSLREAISLLRERPDAKILAGGHSLLPMMKLGLAAPSALVDIGRIPDLAGIRATETGLRIGALTTHATIAGSSEVHAACPVLAAAAEQIGDTQVRHRGTMGGSLAHADPGGDFPTVVTALGATLIAAGPDGERTIPADAFFTGLFSTALGSEELLTWIDIPGYGPAAAGAYLKHRHPASSYAVVGVAAIVSLRDSICDQVRLVIGGVNPRPTRCAAAEATLIDHPADDVTIAAAADRVREALTDPMGDLYASGEYRTHLATVMAKRALALAIDGAR